MQEPEQEILQDESGQNIQGEDIEVRFAKSESGVLSRPKITTRKDDRSVPEPEGQLTIDVYQTPNEIIIESAVAGVSPDDLDIHVSADSVTIRGARKREKSVRDEDYLYQECYWGKFARSVILPQEIDAENAQASFRNGILRVQLPKILKQKTKKLKVQVD